MVEYIELYTDYVKEHEAAYAELKRLLVNATARERKIAEAAREEAICARAIFERKRHESAARRKMQGL